MKLFAELFEKLDSTTSTNAKIEALVEYFEVAPPRDAAWAVYFLTGRRLKRLISSLDLRRWVMERLALPEWLYADAHEAVGDTAETISLLLKPSHQTRIETGLADWVEKKILPLMDEDEAVQKAAVNSWWDEASTREILVINKLLTGALRIGVSQTLVEKALAKWVALPAATLAHRLMGEWRPTASFMEHLRAEAAENEGQRSRPYPFFLASRLEEADLPVDLSEWFVESKWDGIRAQIICREGEVHIWSRGEELITERFPEIKAAAQTLPAGTVLDGEILAFENDRALPFAKLQQRIQRKKLSPAILKSVPVVFMGFDCLEADGNDLREHPLSERRKRLEELVRSRGPLLQASPLHDFSDLESARLYRSQSRERGIEGLMLKRKNSPYRVGRRRGDWWKWKIEPYSVDTVLIYAQAGNGRRANLFTDYTFAVWDQEQLVPVAKAYSGLSDEEIRELDRWIRAHTKERFGPVRSVDASQVFEIAFEGIAESSRHRSGVAVRFPRILRWRKDKPVSQADSLKSLRSLIDAAH